MPLDFGDQLFKRDPLQQETGLLKERWGQGGSAVINVQAFTGSADRTLYTVTAGKRLFIKTLVLIARQANAGFLLEDGEGGANKFAGNGVIDNETYTFVFDVPLFFDTSVFIDSSDSTQFGFTGWEE